MKKIAKPSSNEHALYYEKYVQLVDENISVLDTLKSTPKIFEATLLALPEHKLVTPYMPGKWSIKDLMLHLADTELVFLYRAMRFARNDKSPLPFFDENEFANQANANALPIKKILKQYKNIRLASITFFSNQTTATLKRSGTASNAAMSVRACAWIIAGHELHHWKVIQERYDISLA